MTWSDGFDDDENRAMGKTPSREERERVHACQADKHWFYMPGTAPSSASGDASLRSPPN